MPTFGIDLGTTFSAIARCSPDGNVNVIPVEGQEVTMPSAVLFRPGGTVLVGKAAVEQSWEEGSRLVQFAKRDIGLNNAVSWQFEGWTYHPEDISAIILRRICEVASAGRGAALIKDVVVSHPQYFHISQKEATKEACRLAGLTPVGTISEPNAAAVTWGAFRPQGAKNETIMVFDLGGGTFDVSLARVADGTIDFPGNGGDARFGGVDWDQVIINIAQEEFRRVTGDEFVAVADRHQGVVLQIGAAEAKIALSKSDQWKIRVAGGPHEVPVLITREAFEARSKPLVQKCMETCDKVLKNSGMEWASLDRILLVGSATKMPMIAKVVKAISGCEVTLGRQPKLDVVQGAAIWAHWLDKGLLGQDVAHDSEAPREEQTETLLNLRQVSGVTNRGLGILTSDNLVAKLINGGERTPATASQEFEIPRANARSIRIPLYEGDSEIPEECSRVGEVIVDDLPPLPKHSPIKVTIRVDVSGALDVTVIEPSSGKEKVARVERGEAVRGNGADKVRRPSFEERRRQLESLNIVDG